MSLAVEPAPGLPGTSFISRRFHFVGVAGSGMSGLARLLHGLGAEITGSDGGGAALLQQLREEGFDVWAGSHPERIHSTDGYVIRSAAVPATDVEVQNCVRLGYTPLLYAEAVGRLSEGRRTLAIAGTHGKTTTTGLVVAALRAAGVDPSHLVGGEVPELGGNGHGGSSPEFVVEACEFNRSFHNLRPFGAAILNCDHDHFDCYPSTDDLIDAYSGYLARVRPGGAALLAESVPQAVLRGLRNDVEILTVGAGLWADIRALDVRVERGCFSFAPMLRGQRLPRLQLTLAGRHNLHNALFALGLSLIAGADPVAAAAGVAAFGGVRRRFELHQGPAGGILINDYAHHPAEIQAVVQTARQRFAGQRLLVVFQPHQHQRTLQLLPEFAEALATADHVVVADIYGARESAELRAAVSAHDLVAAVQARGGSCVAGGTVEQLAQVVSEQRRHDAVVLLLGAGDIDQALGGILEQL